METRGRQDAGFAITSFSTHLSISSGEGRRTNLSRTVDAVWS